MSAEKLVDLHMHSTFSDGVHSPTALVDIAVNKKLAAISLSDHDSLNGFDELSSAASTRGVEVISGVELSCEYLGRDLHILGYGVATSDGPLQDLLKQFRKTREERGIGIIAKLRELDIHIEEEVVLAKAGDGALGRPHIAEALLEGGHVSDFSEAFDKYIGEDGPAYVDKYKMAPNEAVKHIHAAGGVALVAHPGFYLEDKESFLKLLDEGFDGIEVHHPHHNRTTIARLLEIAEERSLLVSGGSDFHGFAGRDNMGAPPVRYELLARIKSRIAGGT